MRLVCSALFLLLSVMSSCSFAQEEKTLSGYFVKYRCDERISSDHYTGDELFIQLKDTTIEGVIKTFHKIIANPDSLVSLIDNGETFVESIDPRLNRDWEEMGYYHPDLSKASGALYDYCEKEIPLLQYRSVFFKLPESPRSYMITLSVFTMKVKVLSRIVNLGEYCNSDYYSNGYHVVGRRSASSIRKNVLIQFLGR